MKRTILTALWMALATWGGAQTTLSGVVTDENQHPLPGANVYIKGSYDGCSTAADGSFSLKTAQIGEQFLWVEFMGFETWKQALVLDGNPLTFTITLKEAFNELKAASITAGAFEASDAKKAVVLKPLDIVTTAGATGDISGALQTLPGTTAVGESGRLFVRGGHSNETQTFIDGLLVYSPYIASAPNTATRGRFNPFMFSGTVFSTGGYSAEYGQALSSALILKTNDMPDEEEVDLGIMTVGGDLSGTKMWDRGAVTAQVGYFDLKPYIAVVQQDFDWERPYQSFQASANVRQEMGDTGMLKFYSTVNRGQFSLYQKHPDFPNGRYVGIQNDNLFVNASYRGLVGEKNTLRMGLSWTDDMVDTDLKDARYVETLKGGHAKVAIGTRFTDRFKLNIGVEVFERTFGQDYQDDFVKVDEAFTDQKAALFSEGEWHVTNRLVTRIGIRGEHSNYLDAYNLAPRLSAAFKTGEHAQFSLAYGKFYQDPWNELLIRYPHLESENAEHFIANYQYMSRKRTFRIEAYQKNYRNLAHANNSEIGYDNSGSGYARGIDVFWRDKESIKNGDYWISYSYLDTKRNWREFQESAMPHFASTHNLSVVYKHWIESWRMMLGAAYNYGSPRPYNDPNLDGFNTGQTKAYSSLNANCAYLYKQNVIFYVSATNLLGRDNVFGYEFASQPNNNGTFNSTPIVPSAPRFFLFGCFITFSKKSELNQLDKLN